MIRVPHGPRGRLALLALASFLATPAAAVRAAEPSPAPGSPAATPGTTRITSYGEVNLNVPLDRREDALADLRRLVIGLEHDVDENTELALEVELEHAVTSADDPGEVAVEQAFVARRLGPAWSARAGLLLVPMGFLNRWHEPTAYHGVERNLVETAIIPTTWREGAVAVAATLASGVTVQAGVSTGFDLSKWDATSADGQESPLGSIHQELALARAHDASGFGAVDWRGIPGLHLGASAFVGGASQGQADLPRSVVALWDVRARWNPGALDVSALYARGSITKTAELNATLVGGPTLVPESFDGWYVEAAYRVWSQGGLSLTPFARFEQVSTGRSYADLGPGLTPEALPTESVVTAGASLYLSPEVVLKADYQRYDVAEDADRVNVGLGWSF